MLIHRKQIHIEWGDCDPAGIVYFPRYFEYFDACTHALFDYAGLPKQAMIKNYGIVGIPIVETNSRFLIPSSFGDIVFVESSITAWGNSSFHVQHRLVRGETLAVEGTETRVWTVRVPGEDQRIESRPIPAEVKARFQDAV